MTPEQYANSVNAHARRSIVNSLYPGQNYIDLAAWLKAEERQKDSTQHCLAVLRDFSLVGSDRVQYLRVDSLDAITNRPSHPRPEQGSGRVLFLRGCPPAKWITAIGGRYGVDPEFVHRHLDFFATLVSRSVFSLPSLPSSSGNIIKLRVCTILHQQDASMAHVKKLDLQARRREAAENMATYRRNFQTACQAGDSIVRDFSAINKEYCILEQQISICVQKDEDGWLGKYY